MRGRTTSLLDTPWPSYDEAQLVEERVTIVIQVDGKLRDRIEVDAGASREELEEIAVSGEKIVQHLEGRTLVRAIVVPGRLVNLVTRSDS